MKKLSVPFLLQGSCSECCCGEKRVSVLFFTAYTGFVAISTIKAVLFCNVTVVWCKKKCSAVLRVTIQHLLLCNVTNVRLNTNEKCTFPPKKFVLFLENCLFFSSHFS
jgi:hypothetical protein